MNGSPDKSPASCVGRGLTERGASPALPIPTTTKRPPMPSDSGFPPTGSGTAQKGQVRRSVLPDRTDSVHGFSTDYDVTKAYACDPEHPALGKHGSFCRWAEPETGYHVSDDVWHTEALGALPLAAGYHAICIDYAEIGGATPDLSLDGTWEFYHQ